MAVLLESRDAPAILAASQRPSSLRFDQVPVEAGGVLLVFDEDQGCALPSAARQLLSFRRLQRPQADPPTLQLAVLHPKLFPEVLYLTHRLVSILRASTDDCIPNQHMSCRCRGGHNQGIYHLTFKQVDIWAEVGSLEPIPFIITETPGHEAITEASNTPDVALGPQIALRANNLHCDFVPLGAPPLAGCRHYQGQAQTAERVATQAI